MKKVTRADVCGLLDSLEQNANQEPVILMKGRKPIAVILPVGDADLETVSLSFNPQFHAILEKSRRRGEREGYLSLEEVRKRLGMPPAEVNSRPRKSAVRNHK